VPGRRHARAIDTLSTFRDEKFHEKGLIVRVAIRSSAFPNPDDFTECTKALDIFNVRFVDKSRDDSARDRLNPYANFSEIYFQRSE